MQMIVQKAHCCIWSWALSTSDFVLHCGLPRYDWTYPPHRQRVLRIWCHVSTRVYHHRQLCYQFDRSRFLLLHARETSSCADLPAGLL